MIAYLLIGVAALAMVSGLAYKTYQAGADNVRTEWAEANAEAKATAEADRQRQDAVRATQDKEATKRLADAKRSNAALLTSLDAHIKVARLSADCKLTPGLLSDVNSALAGSKGVSPGAMPSRTGTSPPAR